ncbi:hypothetical protein SOVF_183030 [Spinacia oleracea]|nr:hypothetical protein SOVF_183030 [Spinacia oleracea]
MWFLLLLLLRYCLWCCFAFSFSFPVQSTIVVSNCRIRQPTTQLGWRRDKAVVFQSDSLHFSLPLLAVESET